MGTSLHNPNDAFVGRDGGPYLDEVQAMEAEKRRAAVEGRKPNLTNPGADAGIPLSRAVEMLNAGTVNSHPSRQNVVNAEADRILESREKTADAAKNLITDEINTAAVDKAEKAVKAQEKKEDENPEEKTSDNMFDAHEELAGDPAKGSDAVAGKAHDAVTAAQASATK